MANHPFSETYPKIHFLEVYFHHCKYGSARRKLTKFLNNVPALQELELFCTNDHVHEPWGHSPAGHWTTVEESLAVGIVPCHCSQTRETAPGGWLHLRPASVCLPRSFASDNASRNGYPTSQGPPAYGRRIQEYQSTSRSPTHAK